MSRVLPYLLFAPCIVFCAAAAALAIGRATPAGSPSEPLEVLGFALLFSVVGLLVVRARPRNVIAWLREVRR